MIKDIKIPLQLLALILLGLTVVSPAIAQKKDGRLKIKGFVLDANNRSIEGAYIHLKSGKNIINADTSDSRGKYEIEVDYNRDYDLFFEKKGYATMYVGIESTSLDSSKLNKNYTFILDFTMVSPDSSYGEVNVTNLSSKPFTVVKYDYEERKFIQDPEAANSFIADAYEPEGITLRGLVLDENGKAMRNVLVRIYDDLTRNLNDTLRTDSAGKFEHKVAHNSNAEIEINSDEHYEVFLKIDGDISSEFSEKEYTFEQEIKLIPDSANNINPSAFKNPYVVIGFDSASKSYSAKRDEAEFMTLLNAPKSFPIEFDGEISADSGKPARGTKVILYDTKTNEVINVGYTDKNGKYALNAPDEEGLDIRFEKEGYTPTFVGLDAQIPEEDANVDRVDIPPLSLLSAEAKNLDPSLLSEPLFEMKYNEEKKTIAIDSSRFLDHQEKLAQIQDSLAKIAARDTFDYESYPYNNLTLNGTIIDLNNEPIKNVEVELYHENGALLTTTKTDRNGSYNIKAPYNQKTKVYYKNKGYKDYFFTVDGRVGSDEKDLTKERSFLVPEFPIVSYKYLEKEGLNPDAFNDPITAITYNGKKFEENREMIEELREKMNTPFIDRTIIVNGSIADVKRSDAKEMFMLLKEGDIIRDTVAVDKKGNYSVELQYNKSYRLEVISPEYYPAIVSINTTTETPRLERVNLKFSAPDFTMVKRDDLPLDLAVFQQPVQHIYFDPLITSMRADRMIADKFEEALEEAIADAQIYRSRINISGKVRGSEERRLANVKVFLKEFNSVIDSTITDGRGNYEFSIPFENQLKLVYAAEGYYEQFVELNTSAPKESIADMKVNLLDVQLIEEDSLIDESVFANAYTTLAFSSEEKEFVADRKQAQVFIATALAPKKAYLAQLEREQQIQDSINRAGRIKVDTSEKKVVAKKVEAKTKQADSTDLKQKLDFNKSELISEKKKIESQTVKNDLSLELAKSLANANLEAPKITLDEATLQSLSITASESRKISMKDRMADEELDEVINAKQEQNKLINEIAALSTLQNRRLRVQKIDYDSIYSVPTYTNVRFKSYGKGVKVINKHEVYAAGEYYEFVEVVNWFAFSDFYVNGRSIKESDFFTELEAYKKLDKKFSP